ncbi:TetR/AcrR family transcriptional regulator [Winogradskyella sp.]|uniref:TetR/AcrR family transcriptional regulator n=1 Tax=Winogradskyella sp. TaxID=1883156 RepID=UPI00260A3E28|nr:TetR/AcrR family transcriptional regulator [Winogradskyella sp.]
MITTKQHILQESQELLMKEFQHDYTIDSLSKDLKRSKRTIYRFFESKYELIREVLVIHKSELVVSFEKISKEEDLGIEKLIRYIYLINDTLREIRLSRWYQHAKQYPDIQEEYFSIRFEIIEEYLKSGLNPYSKALSSYGKSSDEITNFIVNSLENYYFHTESQILQQSIKTGYVDDLIFLLYGSLISVSHD